MAQLTPKVLEMLYDRADNIVEYRNMLLAHLELSPGDFASDMARHLVTEAIPPPQKIRLIKDLRAQTGFGLLEAKLLIEEMLRQRYAELSQTNAAQRSTTEPGPYSWARVGYAGDSTRG